MGVLRYGGKSSATRTPCLVNPMGNMDDCKRPSTLSPFSWGVKKYISCCVYVSANRMISKCLPLPKHGAMASTQTFICITQTAFVGSLS